MDTSVQLDNLLNIIQVVMYPHATFFFFFRILRCRLFSLADLNTLSSLGGVMWCRRHCLPPPPIWNKFSFCSHKPTYLYFLLNIISAIGKMRGHMEMLPNDYLLICTPYLLLSVLFILYLGLNLYIFTISLFIYF